MRKITMLVLALLLNISLSSGSLGAEESIISKDFKTSVSSLLIDNQERLQSANPGSSAEVESIIINEHDPRSHLRGRALLTADSGGRQLLSNEGVAIANPHRRAHENLKIGLISSDRYNRAAAVKSFLENLSHSFAVTLVPVCTTGNKGCVEDSEKDNYEYKTPTVEEIEAFDAVLVWRNGVYGDPIALGNNLAKAVENEKVGIVTMFWEGYATSYTLGGNWPLYDCIPNGSYRTSSHLTLDQNTTVDTEVAKQLFQDVESFDGGTPSFRIGTSEASNGCSILARWSDGDTFAAANLANRRVDLNFWPVPNTVSSYGWDASTDGDKIIGNALRLVAHAVVDEFQMDEDTSISFHLSALVTYTISTQPSHGSIEGTFPHFTYTPDTNFYGTDFFTYTASFDSNVLNIGTVSITVEPAHDPPTTEIELILP
mmetsp:Transcript_3986/g.5975  ORF Transcript_3986/g.5975 Transcript_3986/m.5975 type:complete len:429 (+) Transcript_3986:74-1360(+)